MPEVICDCRCVYQKSGLCEMDSNLISSTFLPTNCRFTENHSGERNRRDDPLLF